MRKITIFCITISVLLGCNRSNKIESTFVECDSSFRQFNSELTRDKNNILVVKNQKKDEMGVTDFSNYTITIIEESIKKNLQCYRGYTTKDIIRILGKPYYKELANKNGNGNITYYYYYIKTGKDVCISERLNKKFRPISTRHQTNFTDSCHELTIQFSDRNQLTYIYIR
jgi:hypothetical protein